MKYSKYILFFLMLIMACESNKRALMSEGSTVKKMSSKRIIRKHLAANFEKQSLDAKLKVSFDNGRIDQDFRVHLKMKKDEVIWMKGTKFITVFRLKITPTSVSYFSPYQKDYIETDFSVISDFLGTKITFKQLQNLLLGQPFFTIEGKEFNSIIEDKSYVLSPKAKTDLISILLAINPSNFKLDKQSLRNNQNNQLLEITYNNYMYQDKIDIPKNVSILAKDKKKSTKVKLEYRSIEFDKTLDFSHNTPRGYKRIEL